MVEKNCNYRLKLVSFLPISGDYSELLIAVMPIFTVYLPHLFCFYLPHALSSSSLTGGQGLYSLCVGIDMPSLVRKLVFVSGI